jgi:hypothetical protein
VNVAMGEADRQFHAVGHRQVRTPFLPASTLTLSSGSASGTSSRRRRGRGRDADGGFIGRQR